MGWDKDLWNEERKVGATGLLNFYLTEYFIAEPFPETPALKHILERQRFMREMKPYIDLAFGEWLVGFGIVACWGEARYSGLKSDGHYIAPSLYYGSRERVWDAVLRNPKPFLDQFPSLVSVFDDYDWDQAYGGYRWARIAEAVDDLAQAIRDREPLSWRIDHLVDLAHNNAIWLTKLLDGAADFLDLKSERWSSFYRFLEYVNFRWFGFHAALFREFDDIATRKREKNGWDTIGVLDYVRHVSELRRLGKMYVANEEPLYGFFDIFTRETGYRSDDYEEEEEEYGEEEEYEEGEEEESPLADLADKLKRLTGYVVDDRAA